MSEKSKTCSWPIRRRLAWLVFALLTSYAGLSGAQETCERAGVEFGFFNGVQTTLPQAQEVARDILPDQYGRTAPNGQPISYTLYYNDNQAGITDFIETFEQRLQEQNGLLAGRFELFFSAVPREMSQQAAGLGHGSQGWAGAEPLPCGTLLKFLFLQKTVRTRPAFELAAQMPKPSTSTSTPGRKHHV